MTRLSAIVAAAAVVAVVWHAGAGALAEEMPATRPANPKVPAIRELTVAAKETVFGKSSWDKPLVLKSAKEAGEFFAEEELAKLVKDVNFDQQVVLVFAWHGSGGDKLTHAVAESYPEQVMFKYSRGRTKDLREHVLVFALRSNVTWQVMALQ